jgi:hypothetical protein
MALLPALHGAVGPWDEVISLAPLVIGIILLIYLYRASRRQRAAEDPEPPAEAPPPADSDRHTSR